MLPTMLARVSPPPSRNCASCWRALGSLIVMVNGASLLCAAPDSVWADAAAAVGCLPVYLLVCAGVCPSFLAVARERVGRDTSTERFTASLRPYKSKPGPTPQRAVTATPSSTKQRPFRSAGDESSACTACILLNPLLG